MTIRYMTKEKALGRYPRVVVEHRLADVLNTTTTTFPYKKGDEHTIKIDEKKVLLQVDVWWGMPADITELDTQIGIEGDIWASRQPLTFVKDLTTTGAVYYARTHPHLHIHNYLANTAAANTIFDRTIDRWDTVYKMPLQHPIELDEDEVIYLGRSVNYFNTGSAASHDFFDVEWTLWFGEKP
jgi:hypothetical protein